MSWFSNAAKAVGKAVKDAGHFTGKVLSNPIVDAGLMFIPGVGPVAAGLAAGAGRLIAPGGNIGNALKTGLTTGVGSGLVHGAGSELLGKIPGVGGLLGGGSGAVPEAASAAGGGASNGLLSGGVGGLIKKAGSYALEHPGNILTAAQGVNSALDAASARALEKKAMGYATDDYASRAPLRAAGVAGLIAPPVDVTQSRAYQSPGNPYATDPKPTRRIFGATRRQASS